MKTQITGELIQVDHANIKLDCEKEYKHFTAICPITKYIADQVFAQATSQIASEFLEHMRSIFPFKIKSIQVDGDSEFMGDFEQACKDKNIEPFMLPPRSSKLNGNVERGNETAKYEFYYQYQGSPGISALRCKLKEFNDFYNNYRPHQRLQCLTPVAFYKQREAKQSHML